MFAGKILMTEMSVSELQEDSTLITVSPLDGSGKDKKRKKKAKKTPKKQKRKASDPKHKNKLGLLKLYKVTDNGVECLRKQCPKCGPGIRLASHYDREYCGRCGYFNRCPGQGKKPSAAGQTQAAAVAAAPETGKGKKGGKKGKWLWFVPNIMQGRHWLSIL